MTITLYYHPMSGNSRKPRLAAAHLGVELDLKPVDISKGAHKAPDYLGINPNGMLPAMVDGDLRLFESNVIACYIASKSDNTIWPKDDRRYQIMQWQSWEASHWKPALQTVIFERAFKPMFGMGAPDESAVNRGLESIKRFAPVLNAALEGNGGWLVGNDITLADYCVASTLMWAGPANISIAEHKHIARWFEKVQATPAWKATEPPKAG